MIETQTVQQLAADALTHLEFRSDRQAWFRKDDAPEWVADLCMVAHGDYLPDDYRYEFIVKVLDAIAEADDPEDAICDLESDPYTANLTRWLASNINRVEYLTDAMAESPFDNGFNLLAYAQQLEIDEVFGLVLQFLQNQVA